jgi:malonyl-CoA O-methyltransferase
LEKSLLRESFARAAQRYDDAAVLQREVAARLLDRLDLIRLAPSSVVDIGAGTGFSSEALSKRYRKARMLSLDIALPMLQQTRRRMSLWRKWSLCCADAERLPLASRHCDMVFSNLTLQWCGNPDRVLGECRRVLAPGGLLMFSTLGPDTLKELRASWSAADGYNHVNAFIDMHDIGDALVRAGFSDPVMDMEVITLTYADAFGLMRDLKTLGAHNVTAGRRHGLTGKGRLRAMCKEYEQFRRDGVLPATYEVVYGHAWAPEAPLHRDGVIPIVPVR